MRSGSRPDFTKSSSQRGRRTASGANRAMALRSSRSGIFGLPQSRPCEKDQSRVTISAFAPYV